FRYDQLMDLGWKKLIPVSLFWLLLVAALRIGRLEGWNLAFVLAGALAVGALGWWSLSAALRLGQMDDAELSPAKLDEGSLEVGA
ncbi:MAG: NADH-quinone oxidoreductase subunit, partial [Actinomycetota bacterium]|nr:NADH-quinone oxidoreductase subunit [Actinomycetota bacterium]